jgi:hypothetical protein
MHMDGQDGEAASEWITLGEFARRMGIARASVYGRIKRGTLDARRANRGGYVVPRPPPDHDGSGDATSDVQLQDRDQRDDRSATVASDVVALRIEIARLEERLAASERRGAVELEAIRAQLGVEVAARNAIIEQMRDGLVAERAERTKLAAELAEARKPLLVRVVEAIRRR